MSDERDEKNDPKDGRDRRPRRDDSSSRPNSGRPSSGRPSSGRFGAPKNGAGQSRDGRPPRDGERKPFNRDSKPGERKPFSRDGRPPRDGERKPFNRDAKPGERKPFSRDAKPGERKPFNRDAKPGERKPFNRDAKPGERKPFSRDGRPPRDGDRPPFSRDGRPPRDGERKPFSRDGRPPRDGERKPFSRDGRPPRDGDRPPFSRDGRPPRDGERKPFSRDGRPPAGRPEPREEEFPRFRPSEEQRKAIRDLEPEIENRFAGKELDRAVLRDLSTLSEDNAMVVGRHLEAAAFYAEIDAPRALQHAIAAKNRASRLAVVRETVGIMAYVNEDFALALAELRTAHRISGSNDQVALIIDCLRGLGRSDEGLKLARDVDRAALPREAQVDLAIVLSGIRLDRTETDRAYAELQIPQLDPTNATAECVALFDANAEVLEEMGRMDEAAKWRRYARLTEDHFSPDETIEFHTEYLETPTDVTREGLEDSDDEPELALTDSELSDLVGDVPQPSTSKDDE